MHKMVKYLKEKQGLTYRDEGSWCYAYKVIPHSNVFHVGYLYLEEENRGTNMSKIIWKTVSKNAREHNCEYVSGEVDLKELNISRSLRFLLNLGFEKRYEDTDSILLYKKV